MTSKNHCLACGDVAGSWPHCFRCSRILRALQGETEYNSRERLHKLIGYIAKGVDD